ncbi:glycine cleavage system protein H [Sporomusa termitida]|uniref:Glycine cleavage system H protein n=1 Tax=Sporomusa termitida TaxID=2377 RepID=A0A517DW77_9FIRM|nr:glycine cleavage system protein H [Sporomusa termitida]QDR81597.1 Glycine cleavage system H protein [Sporomusa termitida]
MNGATGNFPEDLLYDIHYQWIKKAGNKILFGLTPYGHAITGDILYLALPPVGTGVEGGGACGSLEAGKWVGRVYAPASGRITNVNEAVLGSPALISRSPYTCWFAEIELSRPEEIGALMPAAGLRSWLAEERKANA